MTILGPGLPGLVVVVVVQHGVGTTGNGLIVNALLFSYRLSDTVNEAHYTSWIQMQDYYHSIWTLDIGYCQDLN